MSNLRGAGIRKALMIFNLSRSLLLSEKLSCLLAFALWPSLTQARVVINEIMYHAPDDLEDLQYAELHNSGSEAVDLGGWAFTRGFTFKFAAGTRIEAKGFLVLCRNAERFKEFYSALAAGIFGSPISRKCEKFALSDVDQVVNYFAVNTVLSHWDGFFNSYFTYHDTHGDGLWTMYHWAQDSTWGLRDRRGGSVFFNTPITFGLNGDRPPGGGFGFGGGGGWWCQPGWFSGPLLANPHFRKNFFARTKEIIPARAGQNQKCRSGSPIQFHYTSIPIESIWEPNRDLMFLAQ